MKERIGVGNIVNRIGNSIRNAVTKIKSRFTSQKSFIVNDDVAVALKQSTFNEKFNDENSIKKSMIKNNKINNYTNSCDSGSAPNGLFRINQLFNLKTLTILFISLLLIAIPVFAVKQLVSLQGKVDFNGVLVDDGNLTVQIHDSPTGGVILYQDFFNDSIQNGFFDVMLGNGTVLDLNLSQTYYLDLKVNGSDLNFSGDDRKIFQSPVGFKLSGLENFSVDTSVLFVDTENDRVGIGNSAPTTELDVTGTVTATSYAGDGSSLTGIVSTTSVWNSSENVVYLNDSNAVVNITGTLVVNKNETLNTTNFQVFTTAGANTWTKPAGAKVVQVTLIGASGGAGGGRRGAAGTNRYGGAGSRGGGWASVTLPASLIGATETVMVGAGGTGGAAATSDNTDGSAGTGGTNSSFGIWIQAGGTSGGGGGTSTGHDASKGGFGIIDGGAGGNGGNPGADSYLGGGGGAYSRSIKSDDSYATVNNNGGEVIATNLTGGAGGANGGTNHGAGGENATVNHPSGGSGGGGGAANKVGVAGNGGNGGLYGGGAGGGGSALNGANSGAGGDGADGIVIVISFT